MERLETRNDIRINNQIQIFEILRKGTRTITEIANKLNISFTAASNIIDEMQKEGLVEVITKSNCKVSRGRIPNYVSLNLKKGIVCAIDLSTRDINVSLCSLDLTVLVNEKIPNAMFITQAHLEKIEEAIKRLLKDPACKNRKLLSICIASPGLIRKENFEYAAAYRVINAQQLNPVLFFKNAFNVKVEMYNDIKIGCLAELKRGVFPKKSFNGMFVHIGINRGITFIFNGKIFNGSNNFAGEIPSYNEIDEKTTNCWNCKLAGFFEIDRIIKEKNNIKLDIESAINVNEIVDKFLNNDPFVCSIVEETCKINALTLVSLCTLLDMECIVIEGPILKFGERYLELLRKYVIKYSSLELRTRILASTTVENSSMIGACYQAVTSYLLEEIQEMARKRLGQHDFELDKSFNEI